MASNKSNDPPRSRRDTDLSRSLSWVLRHRAPSLGLSISADGYVPVSDLLKCHKRFHGYNEEDVRRTVEQCPKQRFKLSMLPSGVLSIRANQGHSIRQVENKGLFSQLSMEELRVEPCIVHGTTFEAWKSIKTQGLSRMKRRHIHFATGLPGAGSVRSGMRLNCQIHIYIDAVKCADDRIVFYRSDNNVLLSSGEREKGNNDSSRQVNKHVSEGFLHPKYFLKVVDSKTKTDLLQETNI